MKKFYALAAVIAFALAAYAAPARADVKALTPAAIGTTVEDFKLADAEGREHALSSLKGKNGTVLIFIATRCPVSNAYNERMQKLSEDYRARGVSVVGINANATESADDIRAHAKEKGLGFVILKDKDNRIADRLGAGHTHEVFFIDASG